MEKYSFINSTAFIMLERRMSKVSTIKNAVGEIHRVKSRRDEER